MCFAGGDSGGGGGSGGGFPIAVVAFVAIGCAVFAIGADEEADGAGVASTANARGPKYRSIARSATTLAVRQPRKAVLARTGGTGRVHGSSPSLRQCKAHRVVRI